MNDLLGRAGDVRACCVLAEPLQVIATLPKWNRDCFRERATFEGKCPEDAMITKWPSARESESC